jgi:SAM-dependent methyltransferase
MRTSKISEIAKHALLEIEKIVKDEKVLASYYQEFWRRAMVLELVMKYCPKGSVVIDLGAQPFIVSSALKLMGYDVIAYDYDPDRYLDIAKAFGVKVVKCDLERDSLGVENETVDCAVFSEVIEHINPYYVNYTLAEINRVLKVGGKLIITTPNIASLFRRLKLLIGKQPVYRLHVKEYTKYEVEELLRNSGFKILESFYTEVNDLHFVEANLIDYLRINGYFDLIRILLKRPSRTNILRTIAFPLVKAIPTLRMIIGVVAEKAEHLKPLPVERW